MNTSKLLSFLAMGLVLSLTVTGCKTNSIRPTSLSDGLSGDSLASGPRGGLNDGGIPGGNRINNEDLIGGKGNALPLDTPVPGLSDKDLTGREQDRATFQAFTVYFDFDRANVKPGEAAKIDAVVQQFKSMSAGHDLLIEGHCDERGTEEYNRALGERRALALREILVRSGVPADHVHTKTFGKDKPAIAGHNEASWSLNRRGEFILVLPRKFNTAQLPNP